MFKDREHPIIPRSQVSLPHHLDCTLYSPVSLQHFGTGVQTGPQHAPTPRNPPLLPSCSTRWVVAAVAKPYSFRKLGCANTEPPSKQPARSPLILLPAWEVERCPIPSCLRRMMSIDPPSPTLVPKSTPVPSPTRPVPSPGEATGLRSPSPTRKQLTLLKRMSLFLWSCLFTKRSRDLRIDPMLFLASEAVARTRSVRQLALTRRKPIICVRHALPLVLLPGWGAPHNLNRTVTTPHPPHPQGYCTPLP